MTNKREIKRYHPGAYIKDSLEALNMSNKEFALRSGISERTLSDLINESGNITFDIAYKLSNFFDTDIDFWTNLQNVYDSYKLKEQEKRDYELDYELIKGYKKYLKDNGFIDDNDTHVEMVDKVRDKLSVNRLLSLKTPELLVSFKEQKSSGQKDNFAQNFWLAYALTEARKNEVKSSYDSIKLISSLENIKSMMKEKQNVLYLKLKKIFAECGVSFVLVPYLPKSNIYGATKWLSGDLVMLAMSNRGERADVFWFTLFHEISHVLSAHKRYCLISSNEYQDIQADKDAQRLLIRNSDWEEFIKMGDFSEKQIIEFAKKENVIPMIVAGRLIKEKHLKQYDLLNNRFGVFYSNKELQNN